MRTIFSRVGTLVLALGLVSILASASGFGPRNQHGRNRQGSVPTSVAEPAAIVLLGAGLVSLGFYAKKKHDKKK